MGRSSLSSTMSMLITMSLTCGSAISQTPNRSIHSKSLSATQRAIPSAARPSKQMSRKSLLTDIISIVATGDRAAVLAMTEDPQEFDKLLSAELMRGRSLIAIDNCNVPLKSTVTLSRPMTELRILGKSELVLVRSNSITIAKWQQLCHSRRFNTAHHQWPDGCRGRAA